MARILVTGGAGFLGSHLCDRLLERGDEVVCVDDFSTGRMANLAHLEGHPGFRLIRHDIAEPIALECDAVLNFGCPASPKAYQSDPVRTTTTCVNGTLNMLRLADACGARLIQASTSEVYGNPGVHPQPEGYHGAVSCTGPRACYDEGKRCAESLVFDFRRHHGLDAKVVRIFNTYGPRMHPHDGRVVSNFVRQALEGNALTVYGDGSQTRSFCYVDDLVDGVMAVLDAPAGFAGPVNLGNPAEISILEVARRVIALAGGGAGIRHAPLPIDDPVRRRPDIALAREALGFAPRVDLEEGLRRTMGAFAGAPPEAAPTGMHRWGRQGPDLVPQPPH
ncbi:UDP-glucuronate decarboxylase [Hasllibacter halocynthiae]|uniref:UDP-glucuronate decarboxylase n=1 Tax=Hasllibacter halocynthiae TaxID=595589 RepID=A0A2T0X932_9RHOB|nr:UDP-glucuronic acid decarboxylase family protein [Hasllibacter halocynthiae]PRY95461.1 UDP-glucuronate decarboxylase [Hasllibacter halocynthiae]